MSQKCDQLLDRARSFRLVSGDTRGYQGPQASRGGPKSDVGDAAHSGPTKSRNNTLSLHNLGSLPPHHLHCSLAWPPEPHTGVEEAPCRITHPPPTVVKTICVRRQPRRRRCRCAARPTRRATSPPPPAASRISMPILLRLCRELRSGVCRRHPCVAWHTVRRSTRSARAIRAMRHTWHRSAP